MLIWWKNNNGLCFLFRANLFFVQLYIYRKQKFEQKRAIHRLFDSAPKTCARACNVDAASGANDREPRPMELQMESRPTSSRV